jgi:hypothetical protein
MFPLPWGEDEMTDAEFAIFLDALSDASGKAGLVFSWNKPVSLGLGVVSTATIGGAAYFYGGAYGYNSAEYYEALGKFSTSGLGFVPVVGEISGAALWIWEDVHPESLEAVYTDWGWAADNFFWERIREWGVGVPNEPQDWS